jgi:VanZ family protein
LMNLKFKNIWNLIGLIQVLLAFYLCLRETADMTSTIPHLDKLFHFSAYALLTFYQIQVHGVKNSSKIFIVFMIQGILIEVLQLMTGYRSFELLDIVANGSGSIYAIFLCKGFDPRLLNRIEKLTLKN